MLTKTTCPDCKAARVQTGAYYSRAVQCDTCGSAGSIETVELSDDERALIARLSAMPAPAEHLARLAMIDAKFGFRA